MNQDDAIVVVRPRNERMIRSESMAYEYQRERITAQEVDRSGKALPKRPRNGSSFWTSLDTGLRTSASCRTHSEAHRAAAKPAPA